VPEQLPDGPDEGHPIATGLLALAGVAVAVGVILSLVVLAGTRVMGIGGGSDEGTTTSRASMYLPKPQKTPKPTGPQITLGPGESTRTGKHGHHAKEPRASKSPSKQITLSGSTTSAGPMAPFNLTGVYPGGEGAILTVQRFENGSWNDFPATGSVSNETFQIPVQTSQGGVNRFRVVDSDSGLKSNEVRITIR
jgi:hypothetical protein